MKQEIERKFLIVSDEWKQIAHEGVAYRQGYLSSPGSPALVRIRIAGEKGILTIKGKPASGSLARPEYEYEIPKEDAEYLFANLTREGKIEKTRYEVQHEGHTWEVDVFGGDNVGLIVAEVEMKSEDEEVILPSWVGQEVSHDHKYTNGQLSERPYSTWNS